MPSKALPFALKKKNKELFNSFSCQQAYSLIYSDLVSIFQGFIWYTRNRHFKSMAWITIKSPVLKTMIRRPSLLTVTLGKCDSDPVAEQGKGMEVRVGQTHILSLGLPPPAMCCALWPPGTTKWDNYTLSWKSGSAVRRSFTFRHIFLPWDLTGTRGSKFSGNSYPTPITYLPCPSNTEAASYLSS